jgi:prepilin-type N-terminal cleavage/methylation domain-containing protein
MEELGGKKGLRRLLGLTARRGGFSLVELMVAMAISLVVLGAMYSIFIGQNKTFSNQESFVEMQQSTRAAMDMMAREIGMAGYDPVRVNFDSNTANNFSGVTVNASQLQIKADLNGDGVIDASNEETIVYAYDATNKRITRTIGGDTQPFAENMEPFTLAYLDGDGNVTATPANVRRIRITITGRTARPDPNYAANGGYRTYTLTSIVAPRNLDYVGN